MQNLNFDYNNKPFDGFFSHILKKKNKNSFVISSSGNSNSDAKNIVYKDWCGCWVSSPIPNSWIKIDLKMNKINLNGYTIRLQIYSRRESPIQSWCVEGSNDNYNWTIIDEHRLNTIFHENSAPQHFKCFSTNSFRFIRLRQTDLNGNGGNSLCLSNIELFGKITTIK